MIPIEIRTFFPGTLGESFFLHYSPNFTGSLGHQFGWLWTTPWFDKISIFFKIVWANKSIVPIEIQTFLGTLGGPFFSHYSPNITGSLRYQFGCLWTTPWFDKISIFFKTE